jgi:hypothetical protein
VEIFRDSEHKVVDKVVANKMVFGKIVASKMTSRQNDKAPVQIGMTVFMIVLYISF